MKLTPTEMYRLAGNKEYDDNKRDFNKDAEEAFEFVHFPEKLKSKIHWLAWDAGHSAGYYDIVTQYFDLVELAKLARGEVSE